jgi:hypothetical protein
MKPTPGPIEVRLRGKHEFSLNANSGDPELGYRAWEYLAVFYGATDHGFVGIEKARDNAILAADAFNTYTATGLTPSELSAQRDELLAALENCAERLGIHMKHSEDLIVHMQACKAITNATEGKK